MIVPFRGYLSLLYVLFQMYLCIGVSILRLKLRCTCYLIQNSLSSVVLSICHIDLPQK